MICPFCEHSEHRVVESRVSDTKDAIRRRRECIGCGRRFTTYERVEEMPLVVIKASGEREPFDRQELARLEREPPLARGQASLDEQMFDTIDGRPEYGRRRRLRALQGGRTETATLQEGTD